MQYYNACHHFKANCTKFDFRFGCSPNPAGELTVLTDPLAVFKGPVSKAREGNGDKMDRVRGKNGGRGP